MATVRSQPEGASPDLLRILSSAFRRIGALEIDQGILAQAWLPMPSAGGDVMLQTKGLPFSLTGPGDMLALFRCLSCKFSFSPDLKQLAMMGGPGRVYHSGEAETSENVQQCDVSVYSRVKEARDCQVCSTILLPIFADSTRQRAVAVLELVQFRGAACTYQKVFEWSRSIFEACGMYLPWNLETRTFEMQSHAMSIRSLSSPFAFGCQFGDLGQARKRRPALEFEEIGTGSGPLKTATSSTGDLPTPMELKESTSTEELPEAEEAEESEEPPVQLDNRMFQPPRALVSKEDLEKHFGYSLAEAAAQLGVCKTTIKRACRRYGIPRWPRREMLRTAAQQQASQMPVDPKLKATPPENFSRTLQLAAIPARPDMQQVMPLGGPPQSQAQPLSTSLRGAQSAQVMSAAPWSKPQLLPGATAQGAGSLPRPQSMPHMVQAFAPRAIPGLEAQPRHEFFRGKPQRQEESSLPQSNLHQPYQPSSLGMQRPDAGFGWQRMVQLPVEPVSSTMRGQEHSHGSQAAAIRLSDSFRLVVQQGSSGPSPSISPDPGSSSTEALWQPAGGQWGPAAGLEPNDFSANQLKSLENASSEKDAQSLEDLFDDFLNQELIGFEHSDPGMANLPDFLR